MNRQEARQRLNRQRLYGEIKFFLPNKKYGFITECESAMDYFFLRKDVALKDEEIIRHLPVTFSLEEDSNPKTGSLIKRAILVKRIES